MNYLLGTCAHRHARAHVNPLVTDFITDKNSGPNGVRFRGVPLYVHIHIPGTERTVAGVLHPGGNKPTMIGDAPLLFTRTGA